MRRVLDGIRAAFHDPNTKTYQWVQGVIWALIALSIVLVGLELLMPQHERWLHAVDRVVLGVFAFEIALRVLTFRPRVVDFFEHRWSTRLRLHITGRLLYCLHPLNLIDILTVLALVPALRGLRALRLLRLLRTARVFHYSNPFQGFTRAFRNNGVLYGFAFSLLVVTVAIGGISLFLVERESNKAMDSLANGMWWAIVTISTVGYGDITPITPVGRIVAGALMIAGMFFLALFAGIVGHTLLHAVLTIREEAFRMSSIIDHVVICGYESGTRMLLDSIREEIDPERRHVIIFAPGERPADVPPEFLWVSGDPSKESELDKVRLVHAAAVVLVGPRSLSPQHADAMTILIAFTLRAYLSRQPETAKRTEPLYVVAEILDSENVEHAKAAGVDEVIETTRLGFSLLAHATSQHGTAELMSEVARVGAHSLYVGRLEQSEGRHTFADVRKRVRESTGALVIGVHDPQTGEDKVNPPDDLEVASDCRVIYLAEEAVLPMK